MKLPSRTGRVLVKTHEGNPQFPQINALDYAPGASMRQDVYRVAFDEASAELSEILGKFELLRLRKDRIEKVVEALKPLVLLESQAPVGSPAERQPVPMEVPSSHVAPAEPAPVASAPNPIPYPAQQGSDPFARRIETAVGQGSSTARDVSEYSRLFNTGVSRGN
jgi:hypothetical protein